METESRTLKLAMKISEMNPMVLACPKIQTNDLIFNLRKPNINLSMNVSGVTLVEERNFSLALIR